MRKSLDANAVRQGDPCLPHEFLWMTKLKMGSVQNGDPVLKPLLPVATLVLAVLYGLYAISHYFILTSPAKEIMSIIASGTSLIFSVAAYLHSLESEGKIKWTDKIGPHVLVTFYGFLCLFDAVVHLNLTQLPHQTTDLIILQVGFASVILHWWSFAILNVSILASFFYIALQNWSNPLWMHFAFAFMATTALSIVIFIFRRDNLANIQRMQSNELQRQKELLHSSKMMALGEMASGIAHEVNNPLMIILGKATQLKDLSLQGRLQPEKLRDDLDKIENTVVRISKIVKGLRAFSRNTEADPKQSVAFKGIVEETISLCGERIKKIGVAIDFNGTSEAQILCRSAEISQVVMNLLQNALEAIENLDDKWLRVEIREKKDLLLLKVTDSGPGIPTHVQEKMMQPFFTTKEVGQGTGLGLSISKGIVEEHGGILRYDPLASHTTFIVELPKFFKER